MTSAVFFKNAPVGGLQLLQPAEDERGILARVYLLGPKKDLGSALSGPITIDFSDEDVIRNDFSGKLAGNVQISFSNPPGPMRWHVELEQADAGGKTVSWQESVVWLNSAGAPAMPQYDNEKAIYTFRFDGTTIYGTQSYLGYPSRRNLLLPHAHGISWSQGGAWNANCSIVGGAEAGLPDGTFTTLNQIVYQAKAGHVFYGQMFMAAGMSPTVYPLIALGSTTSGLSAAGNPTMCIAISSGGTLPTAGVTDSFVMYAAQVAGGDQCPHFRTADNKTILLKQRRKADYNNWETLTDLLNALAANGVIDAA